jgi:hypothetical protein
MKSMVLIMAISSVSRYTAASSEVSIPTRRFGSEGGIRPESASDRSVGPIFAAQPQVRASPVRVFFLNSSITEISFLVATRQIPCFLIFFSGFFLEIQDSDVPMLIFY